MKNFGENFIGAHWCPLKDTTPPTFRRKTNNHKTLKFTKVFSFARFCIALFVTALGIIQSNFFLHQIVNSVDDLTEEGLMKLWRGRKDAPRFQSDQSAASDESHDPKPTDQSNHTEEQPPQEQAPDQPEPPPESHDQIDPRKDFKINHLSMQQLCSEMETIRTSSSCLQLLLMKVWVLSYVHVCQQCIVRGWG